MILTFFRFELREQLRSPLLWLLAFLFAALAFAAASSEAVQIGGGVNNVHSNAPIVVARFMGIFTMMGMLVSTLFVSNALLRDFELGTSELIFASPIKRRDYLAGRILAAICASLVVYLIIALGIFLGPFMPWVDKARVGPVSLASYAWTFTWIVLPNVLFTTALLSLLAALTRSILWVYIGLVGFFVLYGVSASLLSDIDNVWVATLTEPLGMRALGRTVRYWAAEQSNTRLPEVAGYLLANRALWLGGAVARPWPAPMRRDLRRSPRRACAPASARQPAGTSSCARCALTPSASCAGCRSSCCWCWAWQISSPPPCTRARSMARRSGRSPPKCCRPCRAP